MGMRMVISRSKSDVAKGAEGEAGEGGEKKLIQVSLNMTTMITMIMKNQQRQGVR